MWLSLDLARAGPGSFRAGPGSFRPGLQGRAVQCETRRVARILVELHCDINPSVGFACMAVCECNSLMAGQRSAVQRTVGVL
jgi:hypothetical protein